jgi:hypothetical protein
MITPTVTAILAYLVWRSWTSAEGSEACADEHEAGGERDGHQVGAEELQRPEGIVELG